MPIKLLREYGVGTVVDFSLFDPSGINLTTDAVHVVGDTRISIDGTDEGNTINGFTNVDQGYRIAFDASEVTGKSMRIPIVDQDATKIWLDDFIIIETYGHELAMHPFATLDTLIDGISVETVYELLMAMVNGRFAKGVPTIGDITFYKRDNVTPLTVVNVDENTGERTRLS